MAWKELVAGLVLPAAALGTALSVAAPAGAMTTAAVLTEGCVITAGHPVNSESPMAEMVLAKIEVTRQKPKQGGTNFSGATIPIQLGAKVIDSLFEGAKTYISNRAEPPETSFGALVPTTLLHLTGLSNSGDAETYEVRINANALCMTVVADTLSVTRSETQTSTSASAPRGWQPQYENGGPDLDALKARLKAAGFVWKDMNKGAPGRMPPVVFEGRWVFSPDGRAARFVPLYLFVSEFENPINGKPEDEGKRSMALKVTMSLPAESDEKNAAVLFAQLNMGQITLKSGDGKEQFAAGTVAGEPGLAPRVMRSLFGEGAWHPVAIDVADAIKPVKAMLEAKPMNNADLGFYPVNVEIDMTMTEKPGKVIEFLADFIKDEDLTETLATAVKAELGLVTEGEKKEAVLAAYDKQIKLLEEAQNLLEGAGNLTETQKASLESIKSKLIELKLARLQFETGLTLDQVLAIADGQ